MFLTRSLVHQIEHWANTKGDVPAIHEQKGRGWRHLTWAQYWRAIREVGKGLIALGLQPGECVAIVGNNRIDWVLCQFGIMAARGIPAPIYVTNTDEQVAYIVSHSRSKIAICDSTEQLKKYERASAQGLMEVDRIITMDPIGGADGESRMSLKALRALGRSQSDEELDFRLNTLRSDETSMLIYTSGTTGVPKAVQLEHGGMIAVANGIFEQFEEFLATSPYRSVSYLPLCHVAEQVFTNFLHLLTGGQVYFCPDLKKIKDYLVHVRPTIFLGVPRVWEKFQAALEAKLAEAKGIKGKLAKWAREVELEAFKSDLASGEQTMSLSRRIANALVISKIKDQLGLDELGVAVTGAAPISISTLEFFAGIGLPIYEGYGMSETTGVASCPPYRAPSFGSIGPALPGVKARIAEDGELLLQGRNMTRGYLYMPKKTAELLDHEGWLHTGDLASIDEHGYIRITGRKKDILITAGGKNVAPAEMEAYIKSIPGVGQAVVVGDRQPYLCALVTLDPENLDEIRNAVGASGDLAALANNAKVHDHVMKRVEAVCNAEVARYQTIKKIKILPVEFSVETDELTPTMKIKRNVVTKKFASEIEAFYA